MDSNDNTIRPDLSNPEPKNEMPSGGAQDISESLSNVSDELKNYQPESGNVVTSENIAAEALVEKPEARFESQESVKMEENSMESFTPAEPVPGSIGSAKSFETPSSVNSEPTPEVSATADMSATDTIVTEPTPVEMTAENVAKPTQQPKKQNKVVLILLVVLLILLVSAAAAAIIFLAK